MECNCVRFEKTFLCIHGSLTKIYNELEPEKDLTTRNFGRGLFGRPVLYLIFKVILTGLSSITFLALKTKPHFVWNKCGSVSVQYKIGTECGKLRSSDYSHKLKGDYDLVYWSILWIWRLVDLYVLNIDDQPGIMRWVRPPGFIMANRVTLIRPLPVSVKNDVFKKWVLWYGGELERHNYLYLPYLFLDHCHYYILYWRSLRKSSKWRSCSMVSLYYSCVIWNKFFIFNSHEYLSTMAHWNTNLGSLDRTLVPYQL